MRRKERILCFLVDVGVVTKVDEVELEEEHEQKEDETKF